MCVYMCMCMCDTCIQLLGHIPFTSYNTMQYFPQGGAGSQDLLAAKSEALEKLNEAWGGLDNAVKLSSKIQAKAEESLQGASSKFKTSFQEITSTMEIADSCVADLGFLVKYKKTRDHLELTIPLAQKVLTMAATALQNLMDSTKSMRALLP